MLSMGAVVAFGIGGCTAIFIGVDQMPRMGSTTRLGGKGIRKIGGIFWRLFLAGNSAGNLPILQCRFPPNIAIHQFRNFAFTLFR